MAGKRTTVLASLAILAGMTGLTAAAVPLYDLFCRVTGYGGVPRTAEARSEAEVEQAVTVRFDANTARDLPWRFEPEKTSVTVRLGENVLAFYKATNLSDQAVTGTATFNVTPTVAGGYVNKVECFCFTEQTLLPGESVDMPVSFFVDPALADYTTQGEIRTITLSYSFFRTEASE